MVIDVNAEQLRNAISLILPSVEVGVNVTDANKLQLENAPSPIFVTELPIVTDVNAKQLSKAISPIIVTELPIVTDVNAVSLNA